MVTGWAKKAFLSSLDGIRGGRLVVQCPDRTYEFGEPGELDAVLICDAYYEMEQPVALLRNAALALKKNGRLGIVEFTTAGGGPGPPMDERVDPERVIREASEAGLRLIARPNMLRYQYMLVFAKADATATRGRESRKQ